MKAWYVKPASEWLYAMPDAEGRPDVIPISLDELTARLEIKGIRPRNSEEGKARFFARDIPCHESTNTNNAALYITDRPDGTCYAWCFVCENGEKPAGIIKELIA